jgi:hypothetical protein
MRTLRTDRPLRTCSALTALVAFLMWSMPSGTPVFAQSLQLPLGLAAGSKEAHLTLDGKRWTTLGHSSTPVYEGTVIRTGNGLASALLKDGTQLELQPRSIIEISGSRAAPVVKIAVGRVLFRLPAPSKTVLVTPSVRYQALANGPAKGPAVTRVGAATPNSFDRMGEVIVNLRGGSRIELRQGEMLARPVNDPGLHIIKTGQSVYIPQVGKSDPPFKALLAQALPGGPSTLPVGAIPVYSADGKSVGYIIIDDGSFASSPGITPNLPNPVPAGTIPQDVTIPPGATPIFTAEPAYAGYILGDRFVAFVPLGGAVPIAGAGAGSIGAYGAGLAITGLALAGGIAAVSLSNAASNIIP